MRGALIMMISVAQHVRHIGNHRRNRVCAHARACARDTKCRRLVQARSHVLRTVVLRVDVGSGRGGGGVIVVGVSVISVVNLVGCLHLPSASLSPIFILYAFYHWQALFRFLSSIFQVLATLSSLASYVILHILRFPSISTFSDPPLVSFFVLFLFIFQKGLILFESVIVVFSGRFIILLLELS